MARLITLASLPVRSKRIAIAMLVLLIPLVGSPRGISESENYTIEYSDITFGTGESASQTYWSEGKIDFIKSENITQKSTTYDIEDPSGWIPWGHNGIVIGQGTKVTLTWPDASDQPGFAGYQLWRAATPDTAQKWLFDPAALDYELATQDLILTAGYVDNLLDPETLYFYYVNVVFDDEQTLEYWTDPFPVETGPMSIIDALERHLIGIAQGVYTEEQLDSNTDAFIDVSDIINQAKKGARYRGPLLRK